MISHAMVALLDCTGLTTLSLAKFLSFLHFWLLNWQPGPEEFSHCIDQILRLYNSDFPCYGSSFGLHWFDYTLIGQIFEFSSFLAFELAARARRIFPLYRSNSAAL